MNVVINRVLGEADGGDNGASDNETDTDEYLSDTDRFVLGLRKPSCRRWSEDWTIRRVE